MHSLAPTCSHPHSSPSPARGSPSWCPRLARRPVINVGNLIALASAWSNQRRMNEATSSAAPLCLIAPQHLTKSSCAAQPHWLQVKSQQARLTFLFYLIFFYGSDAYEALGVFQVKRIAFLMQPFSSFPPWVTGDLCHKFPLVNETQASHFLWARAQGWLIELTRENKDMQ